MKIGAFFFLVLMSILSPNITKVREDYKKAFANKEVTIELNKDLSDIETNDDKLLVAYKGAVLTLMAKHSKITKEKKTYFKEGATLLNFAIDEQPTNVEMRCVRLGVQENTPKILKYRANKPEDKQMIIDHFDAIKSKEIKSYVRGFVVQSKSFTDKEKELFN